MNISHKTLAKSDSGNQRESAQRDSGLECLAALGAHHRTSIDLEHLRHELNLSGRPASARDLAKAARLSGLKARLFERKDFKQLQSAPRPCIVKMKDGAFRILVAVDDDEIRLFNPADPAVELRTLD
jgi:subfamily B ATP-binding cassette protein HlyB/CyaB